MNENNSGQRDTAGLVARIRSGNDAEGAWAELLSKEFRARVYNSFGWSARRRGWLDEAWSMTLVVMARKIADEPQDPATFDAYFTTTFRRHVGKIASKEGRIDAVSQPLADDLASGMPGAEDQAVIRDHHRYLTKRMRQADVGLDQVEAMGVHIATGKVGKALAQGLTGPKSKPVKPSAASTRLSRARDQLKEALTAVHLARLARDGTGCPELVDRFATWAAPTLPPADRRWVQGHRGECADCRQTLYAYPLTGREMAARALELLGHSGTALGRRHATSPNKIISGRRGHGFFPKALGAATVTGALAVAVGVGVPSADDRPEPIVAPNITTSRTPAATPTAANQQVVASTTQPTASGNPGSTDGGPGRPRPGQPEPTPAKPDPTPAPTKVSTTPTSSTPPEATVTAEAIRASYTGPCPPSADSAPRFRATIRVNKGPVTVSYQWLASNGGSSDPELKTITFNGTGPQERTVEHAELSYLPDETVTDWVALYVRVPNDVRSNKVSYTMTCD
jgi:hypothetical protein